MTRSRAVHDDSYEEVLGQGHATSVRAAILRTLDGVARLHGIFAAVACTLALGGFTLTWQTGREYVLGEDGFDEVAFSATGLTAAPWHLALTAAALVLCALVAAGKLRHRGLGVAALLALGAAWAPVEHRGHDHWMNWPIEAVQICMWGAACIAGMGFLSTWRAPDEGPRRRLGRFRRSPSPEPPPDPKPEGAEAASDGS